MIFQFQQFVRNELEVPSSEQWAFEILADLAHDLSFYEPDLEVRQEDPAFFGDDRAEEEIRKTLGRLEAGSGERHPPSSAH